MSVSVEKTLRKAQAYLRAREFSKAEVLYDDVLAKFPKNKKAIHGRLKAKAGIATKISSMSVPPQNHMQELINLYYQGEFETALSRIKATIALFSNSVHLFNLEGASNAALDRYEDAITSYLQALKINPNYSEAHCNMGIALHHQGKLDAAIEAYTTALKIKPDDPNALNNIGISLKDKGEMAAAIENFQHAVKLKPDYADAYNNLGIALNDKGDLEGAINCYARAAELEPSKADFHHGLGRAQQSKGDFTAAMESYKRAIEVRPDQADFYYDLGNAQLSSGQRDLAIDNYNKAIEIKPDYSLAHHMLASLAGQTTQTAPKEYVLELFENYAARFDYSLLDQLEYTAPRKLAEIIFANQADEPLGSVLDLGCGTGLVGAELKNSCSNLDGIDLSNAMLEQARGKGIYDKLECSDIKEYLSFKELNFDYFIFADVFIYVGDLTDIFYSIKSRNKKPRAKLVFSTEHSEKEGYFLETSGRYSHSKLYIEKLCEKFNYRISYFEKNNLRKDKDKFLVGGFYLLDF